MIVQLTISDSRWQHLLVAKEDERGHFYVYLADAAGNRVKWSPFQGGFRSLEAITHNAHTLYLSLVKMKEQAAEARKGKIITGTEYAFFRDASAQRLAGL